MKCINLLESPIQLYKCLVYVKVNEIDATMLFFVMTVYSREICFFSMLVIVKSLINPHGFINQSFIMRIFEIYIYTYIFERYII